MNVIVKLPVEIPEETIAELAKQAADQYVNDERDLVPVVRCKDCEFRNKFFSCYFDGEPFGDNEYCSKGERKT